MRKFLLSIALFGAFLSIGTTLVSCGDDYDDSKLTEQIADNKTALETRLTALETAQAALPTLATIQAQIATEVTTAKEAAIAASSTADAAQLATVNASINALKTELTDLIASNKSATDTKLAEIDTQFAGLAGRLTTLEGLVSDNTTNLAAVTAAQTALTSRVSSLEGDVADNVTAIASNKALIEAQKAALKAYKTLVNNQLADVVDDINAINTTIADLTTRLEAGEAILAGITNDDLTAMKTFLADWSTERAAISTEISDLGMNLTAAFRSLLNNLKFVKSTIIDYDGPLLIYVSDTIKDNTPFGPATDNQISLPAIGTVKALFEYDNISFMANPSNVDWTNLKLNLENSKGEVLTGLNLSSVEKYSDYVVDRRIPTRAETVGSGVLTSKVSFENDIMPDNWEDQLYIERGQTRSVSIGGTSYYHLLFSLVASEKNLPKGQSPRKVSTDCSLMIWHSDLTIDLNLFVQGGPQASIYDQGNDPTEQEMVHPTLLGNSRDVWKKYITIKQGQNLPTGIVDGVDKIVDGHDQITLSTSDVTLANKTVTFVYHYMYLDGQRGEAEFDVLFTKLLYAPTDVVLESYVNFGTNPLEQQAQSQDVLGQLGVNIPDIDAWLNGVDHISVAPINTQSVLPFMGYINFSYSPATISNRIEVPSMTNYSYTNVMADFETFTLNYSVYDLVQAGRYGTALSFYDSLGNMINVVNIYVDINPSMSYSNVITKVTNVWNDALTENSIWAQLSDDGLSAVYDVNSSYNGDLEYLSFSSDESTPAFNPFSQAQNHIFTIDHPSTIADHNNGVYPAISSFSPFVNMVWALEDHFDFKVLSPIHEATPAWASSFVNELTYTDGGVILVTHDDVLATDPSSNSNNIYYIGGIPTSRVTYNDVTDRDWRIGEVSFAIIDPNEDPNSSSNVGLVEIKDAGGNIVGSSIDNPESFMICAKPQNGQYPVISGDAVLILRIYELDVFGFKKHSDIQFVVKKGQTN